MPDSLKDTREQLEAAKALWELLVSCARNHPAIAFLILLVTLLTAVDQLRTLWVTLARDLETSRSAVVGASLVVTVLAGTITIIVSTRAPGTMTLTRPAPNTDIVGDSVNIGWKLTHAEGAYETNGIVYVVEYLSGGVLHEARTFAQYHVFHPAEGQFMWQVRAEQGEAPHATPIASWSEWQTNYYYRNTLARVRATSILRVSISSDYLKPFYYHNEHINNLDGIDIRVLSGLTRLLEKDLTRPHIRLELSRTCGSRETRPTSTRASPTWPLVKRPSWRLAKLSTESNSRSLFSREDGHRHPIERPQRYLGNLSLHGLARHDL